MCARVPTSLFNFQYLANGLEDCVEIWCVARDPLDKSFTRVRDVTHLHVSTCTPLSHEVPSRSLVHRQGALLVVTIQVIFLVITIVLKARINSFKAELKFNFGFNPRTAGGHICAPPIGFSQIV